MSLNSNSRLSILAHCCVVQLVCFLIGATAPMVKAQTVIPLKVRLDSETFGQSERVAMQPLADKVANMIDQMIPGRMSEVMRGDILCYNLKGEDAAQALAPITRNADVIFQGEPQSVIAGQPRIALNGVTSDHPAQFVYQLSHEIAHVKMGVRLDNYLIETFAVAVSHEVLMRFGMVDYFNLAVKEYSVRLPGDIETALAKGDVPTLEKYWQNQSKLEGIRIDDRAFQIVGANLIRSRAVSWSSLLGIALMNGNCPLNTPVLNFRQCPPDISRMSAVKPILQSLGYFEE